MDPTTFDALLRQVARQTTRRAALAALLGGALLLHDPAASEATRRAQRRRRRRRHESHTHSLRPISIRVDNTRRTGGAVEVLAGFRTQRSCCEIQNRVIVPLGESVTFDLPDTVGYVVIRKDYWFEFVNPYFARPYVSVAEGGWPRGSATCCNPISATTHLRQTPMNEGGTVNVPIYSSVFRVTRHRDTNYKVFTVTIPARF